MKHLPSTKQLQYFLALKETKHFGKAAEMCFISQSAFSSAIKTLEETLGVQLIDRTNKQVTITISGQRFAEIAAQHVHMLEQGIDEVQHANNPLSGKLHLGVIPTIAPFLLPTWLPELRKNMPELEIYLTEDLTQNLYQKLMAGQLDLLLLALPMDLPGTEQQPLFDDEFLLLHSTQVTQSKSPIDINTLDEHSLLLLEDGHCLKEHALAACHLKSQTTLNQFRGSSIFALIEMVRSNMGQTLITHMMAESQVLNLTGLEVIPLSGSHHRKIGLVWRKGSQKALTYKHISQTLVLQSHK